MAWLILLVAGLCETGWVVGMKLSHGFTRPVPSVITVALMVASMGLLAWAMRSLPMGASYAVWTGIGALGAVILGIVFFGESAAPLRLVCIGLILAGIIGLKFS